MPHVIIKMYPGRSEQVKQELVDAITRDVMTYTKVGEHAVSVSIEEVKPADWAEKVYDPDITAKPEGLYKKPGYERP